MNIHAYSISRVNGPGERFTLWTQGCSKKCLGCYNPETWSLESNKILSPFQIFELIRNYENIDGVTITGGDPFEQSDSLLELLMLLKGLDLKKGIIVFTGFSIDEINKDFVMRKCLDYLDVLIDGKFEQNLKVESGLRGSSNQNIIYFSSKILPGEIEIDHEVEIGFDGTMFITGFPKLDRKILKEFGVKIKNDIR
jgi:anaerobic ribonucleoside-triphosphate reductase activating protein